MYFLLISSCLDNIHRERSQILRGSTGFACEGNLIWVDELKADRLPRLVESFSYAVKKDLNKTGTLGRDEKPVMGGGGL